MSELDPCPECGGRAEPVMDVRPTSETSATPVVYGLPTLDAVEQAERGEVILGGCLQPLELLELGCTECGHTWVAGWVE